MSADVHTAPLTARDDLANGFAWLSLAAWAVSVLAPTYLTDGGFSIMLCGLVLTLRGAFDGGPWAAFANLAILWIAVRIITGRRVTWSVFLCFALPASSALYWDLLLHPDRGHWGVYAWTVSIVLSVTAGVLQLRTPAGATAVTT